MTLPSWIAWPGGLPCPWTRGTVDTEACARPPGASDGANEVGPTGSGYRPVVGSGAGLVGGVLAAWGSGMPGIVRPDPSTLGAVGERGSHRESCLQLVPGNDGDWLTRYGRLMTLTGWAAGYAEELLAPLGDRWAHVQGVVRQAQDVSAILPAEEREDLVAAAYLHDLGYAPALVETGFHALDGARHLRALGYERLAGLVAYHSGARCEAELRGLTVELAEFGEWAERWYKTTAGLKPSTRHTYRQLLDYQILPTFEKATLAGVDMLLVREWLAALVESELSPSRIRNAHQVLSQILATAVEANRLARNPAKGVRLPRIIRREMHFLTAAQVEQLARRHHRAIPAAGPVHGLHRAPGRRACRSPRWALGPASWNLRGGRVSNRGRQQAGVGRDQDLRVAHGAAASVSV